MVRGLSYVEFWEMLRSIGYVLPRQRKRVTYHQEVSARTFHENMPRQPRFDCQMLQSACLYDQSQKLFRMISTLTVSKLALG
jgi:hypothetical protein